MYALPSQQLEHAREQSETFSEAQQKFWLNAPSSDITDDTYTVHASITITTDSQLHSTTE